MVEIASQNDKSWCIATKLLGVLVWWWIPILFHYSAIVCFQFFFPLGVDEMDGNEAISCFVTSIKWIATTCFTLCDMNTRSHTVTPERTHKSERFKIFGRASPETRWGINNATCDNIRCRLSVPQNTAMRREIRGADEPMLKMKYKMNRIW